MMIHARAAHEERRSGPCIEFSSPTGKKGGGQLSEVRGRAHAVDDNDNGAAAGRVARIALTAANPTKATTSTMVHSRSERRLGCVGGACR